MKKAAKLLALLLALSLLFTLVACGNSDDNKNDNSGGANVEDNGGEQEQNNEENNDENGEDTDPNAGEPEENGEEAGGETGGEADVETGTEAGAGEGTGSASDYTLLVDGTLTIGMEVGYPPFEYYADDGVTAIGYDVDLAYALGEKLGLDINIINTSYDGIFAGIGVNYDIVCSGVTITPERLETMLFTTPYVENYQAIVARKDSGITASSLNDLTGKTVSMQKGTTSDDLFEELLSTGTIDATAVTNESVVTCLTMVSNGEVDVCLLDSTVADVYIAQNPDLEIIYVDDSEPEQFGIAIGMDNPGLQAALNEAMAELEAEGFFEESDAIWFG